MPRRAALRARTPFLPFPPFLATPPAGADTTRSDGAAASGASAPLRGAPAAVAAGRCQSVAAAARAAGVSATRTGGAAVRDVCTDLAGGWRGAVEKGVVGGDGGGDAAAPAVEAGEAAAGAGGVVATSEVGLAANAAAVGPGDSDRGADGGVVRV